MPYEAKADDGTTYYETRVYKKDFPTQEELAKMFSVSSRTIRRKWQYLTSPSETNKYCPYVIQSEDEKGIYYILLNKEEYFIYLPLPIVKYLTAGFSSLAIRIYCFLLARDGYVKFNGGHNYIFTLMGMAKQIGLSDNARETVWHYPDGSIPQALIALQNGGLIEFERRTDGSRNYYILKNITRDPKDIKTDIPTAELTIAEKEDKKISDKAEIDPYPVSTIIIDNGSPDYDLLIKKQRAFNIAKRIKEINEITE